MERSKMTDHNARQAGITEALNYLQMGIANLELGNGVHMIDFRNAERAILAAHSADARNGEGVVLTDEQCKRAFDVWLDAERKRREFGVNIEEQRGFCSGFAAACALYERLAAPAAPAPTDECERCGMASQSHGGKHWCDNQSFTNAPAPAAQAFTISEEDFEAIDAVARKSYRRNQLSCKGQQVDRADSWDSHVIWATTALLRDRAQQSATPVVPAVNESALTAAVWQRICELPDRNSPEGEPDACVLTLREFTGCMANALEDLNLLPPQGIATTPECTCPSGNGSLRHPCQVHPADAASDPLRAAVQAAVDLMEAREWAEHFAECHAPGDELASRLEACITALHNEAYGGEDRADAASETFYLAKLRNGTTTWLEFTAEAWAKLDSTWIRCEADAASEADKRDAGRYRAVRACGSEWSELSVFDARGHLDAEFLDEAADSLVQRERQQGAGRG